MFSCCKYFFLFLLCVVVSVSVPMLVLSFGILVSCCIYVYVSVSSCVYVSVSGYELVAFAVRLASICHRICDCLGCVSVVYVFHRGMSR